jgi:threonine dehydratase
MLTLPDIWEAKKRLIGRIHRTETIYSTSLSTMRKTGIYLKTENLQKTGSFKVRGAFNKILTLPQEKRERGVIAFSSGNHGQAVAYAAGNIGIPATVVMPEWAVINKVNAAKGYGARVILHGKNSIEIEEKGMEIREKEGLELVHPFEDPMVMAGQGTLGLEVLESLPDVDTVFVAIGGGVLISGTALAIKSIYPKVKIVGVEPEGSCSMLLSCLAGKVVETDRVDTQADGLACKRPGELTFATVEKYVDEIITVTEDEIMDTLKLMLGRTKLLVEPSGATSLAGLLSEKVPLGDKNVAVLSGGNCGFSVLGTSLLED